VFLIYFDESKFEERNDYFVIGGILVDGSKARELEQTLSQIQYNFFGTSCLTRETEIHGKEIFHGKKNCKGRKCEDRLKLLDEVTSFVVANQIPIRLVRIDVKAHRKKYAYPEPEYRLGLMLILERFCDYLDKVNDLGLVFGDYEKDEITNSVLDFSQFKMKGSTPMYGRALGRLIDTIYFTHSHHSRFLQVADVAVYLAQRCSGPVFKSEKYMDQKALEFWERIQKGTNTRIKAWP
jgi:hypothetical protein